MTAGNSKSVVLDLAISADEFLRLYQGAASQVLARANDGQSVRFPANILRPFVHHDGVHGRFVITFDETGKLLSIDKQTLN